MSLKCSMVIVIATYSMSCLTIALALTIRNSEAYSTVTMALLTPSLLLSPALYSVSMMLKPLASLALLNPLTYFIDLAHGIANLHHDLDLRMCLATVITITGLATLKFYTLRVRMKELLRIN